MALSGRSSLVPMPPQKSRGLRPHGLTGLPVGGWSQSPHKKTGIKTLQFIRGLLGNPVPKPPKKRLGIMTQHMDLYWGAHRMSQCPPHIVLGLRHHGRKGLRQCGGWVPKPPNKGRDEVY
jgi:hypothetical protein